MINKKLVVLALILSLVAAGSLYRYLADLTAKLDTTEYRQVVVAKQNVPAKTKINGSMLDTQKIPVEFVHPEVLTKLSEAVGSISRQDLVAGEQLLKSRLVAPGEVKYGLAFAIPEGKRAVTIPVNEVSAVGYLLIPGNKVDVIVTLDLREEQGGSDKEVVQTKTILQDLQVLAVGKMLDTGKTEAGGEVKTVTLAATPQEAQPLVLASERGSVRLLLRSPVDDDRKQLPALRLEDFLESR